MVRNRVISFPRQIIVCLTLSLIIFLFALSCQKDEGIKQKDPNALTKAQAKEYFEQNARTLKFLTTGQTPAGTKNLDYSLTENMIIEWKQAIEGENAENFFVEIPVRMVSPVTALLYDGTGHFNKNIHQVSCNSSLLIEKHKQDGCLHHYVVTTVGSYTKTHLDIRYGYVSNKSDFSGYQLFCSEDGYLLSTIRYIEGRCEMRRLYTEVQIPKVDSLGKDLKYRGISFVFSPRVFTKGGGGGASSGEDHNCSNPNCNGVMVVIEQSMGYIVYYCPICLTQTIEFIDPSDVCPVCTYPQSQCKCCAECHSYPCICWLHQIPDPNPDPGTGNSGEPNEPEEPDKPEPGITICSSCGRQDCDGSTCQILEDLGTEFCRIIAEVDNGTPYGSIHKEPLGHNIGIGATVTLTATPNAGYRFIGWKINDSITETQNPYSFIASVNLTIYAVFAIINQ